jgi:hypothetical protein
MYRSQSMSGPKASVFTMRLRTVPILTAILISALAGFWPQIGYAHGKEVSVTVTSMIPDTDNPLNRLYRAKVLFSDLDPVEGAVMTLTAQREEGGQIMGPIPFHALGEPGLYATEVTYERFGNWVVQVTASLPGEGEASFTDAILPGQAGSIETGAQAPSGVPETLSILFKFDALDLLNVVIRALHSLAGLAWFSLLGVILVAYWFMDPDSRDGALRRLRPRFWPVAGISLAALLLSGIYNGIFDSPIRPPGIFAPSVLLQVPFGDVYLIAFLGKVVAYALLLIVTLRIRAALKTLPETGTESTGFSWDAIGRLGKVGLAVGIFLALDMAVVIYMHYISHLAIVIPQ